jgi:hypothetical protein
MRERERERGTRSQEEGGERKGRGGEKRDRCLAVFVFRIVWCLGVGASPQQSLERPLRRHGRGVGEEGGEGGEIGGGGREEAGGIIL